MEEQFAPESDKALEAQIEDATFASAEDWLVENELDVQFTVLDCTVVSAKKALN